MKNVSTSTTTASSESKKGKSIFERVDTIFSTKVKDAAVEGRIQYTKPLINQIDNGHAAARGLVAVLTILQNNVYLEDLKEVESIETPLSSTMVYDLIGAAKTISLKIVDDTHRTADWTDKFGVQQDAEG